MMFHHRRQSSMSNDSQESTQGEKTRVYVTSLKSITASSPSKIDWSGNTAAPADSAPSSPTRKVLRQLMTLRSSLTGQRGNAVAAADNEPIISESISSSRRLQSSILLVTQSESPDVRDEVRCCKRREADEVIRALQRRADLHIDQGRLHDALHALNRSLALQRKVHGGDDHPDVAATLNAMGEVLSNMGEDCRYMAMTALEESLAIRQGLGEAGSESAAVTARNLWLLLHRSNVAIAGPEREDLVTFQEFDATTQVY